jgi:predicted Zn-dependent protease
MQHPFNLWIYSAWKAGQQLACLVLLFFSSTVPTWADNIQLPEMGDPSGSLMTPIQEQRLGQAFMRSIRKNMDVETDPLMADYIQSLGAKLVSKSPAAGQPFNFFLINDPVVNAFAGPAGHIGIYSGLVLATETESELASVVAHEIAHASQRHLARTFDEANRMSLPMAALALAAIVVGSQMDSGELAEAASVGLQAGMLQHQINFTRANENEADRVGIQILADSDLDPRAMPVFFERMGRATQFYGVELPEFLRTHPVTTNRIADSRGRAEAYPYRHHPEDVRYYLLRAALRERQFKDPAEAVEFFSKTLADGRHRNESGQRYGYVRALMRARNYPQARAEMDKLLAEDPRQIAYIITSAQLSLQSGQARQALSSLEAALQLFPDNYPLGITYAQIQLNQGMPQKAATTLNAIVYTHPHDAQLYQLLSQAAGDAGQTNQAHEYLAEYHYLSGNLEPAIQQLQIALQDRDTELYRSARMAARLRLFQDELAELKRRQ